MKFDYSKLDLMKEKELEDLHDEVHVEFNSFLNGGKSEYTLRRMHNLHSAIVNALIRAGGIHISPIDQLDRVSLLEEEEKKKEENEFILKRYIETKKENLDYWGIKLKNKYFEMKGNPLAENIIYSVKKKENKEGNILEKGKYKIIEDKENFLNVEFLGENLKGKFNFKRNNESSKIWKLTKEGATEKLNKNFGIRLTEKEIREINFLSENRIGASEVARILGRPIQTIYKWK